MRILIIGPAWIGDMVLAQSLFKVLKANHPDASIDVVAPAWTEPLLKRMPEVHSPILLDVKHGELALGKRWRLGRSLRAHGYDQAIVLPRTFKSAIVPFAARAHRRTGYRGEWRYGVLNDIRPLDRTRLPRMVDRYIALALEPDEDLPTTVPHPRLVVKPEDCNAALARVGVSKPAGSVLGLCPGAEYGPAKRWPPKHYAEIARRALRDGFSVWLFGSERDAPVTSDINRLAGGGCLDLAGRTTLGEAIDLLSLTSAVVSNDSGLMHIAAALGRPLVALFGSSTPAYTPPLGTHAHIMYLGLSCSPCFARECPLGHLRCLNDIAPEQVQGALQRVSGVS